MSTRSPKQISAALQGAQRVELVEALDRLVAYEHYYRSVYGHFTKLVSRLGYAVPPTLLTYFDIRVEEASHGQLLIRAFSEVDGKAQDLVSIDQDFRIQASFALPSPRPEYLKMVALRQLRVFRDAPKEEVVEEQGVFKGYFRYQLSRDDLDRRVAYAIGTRAPVLDLKLELGPDDTGFTGETDSRRIGYNRASSQVTSTLEEAYLAQKIFRGEVGRYAKSWAELSEIASFRFEGKDQYGRGGQVPFGDAGSVMEIDAGQEDGARNPSSENQPLEIEALLEESKKL